MTSTKTPRLGVQDGELNDVETELVPGLNLSIPLSIEGVDSKLLNPINTWEDKEEYKKYLNELVKKFQDNFKRFDAEMRDYKNAEIGRAHV